MSFFEIWLKVVEERDADALIGLLHEDFEFVRHPSGASPNKAPMSELMRQMVSNNVVPKARRCLYENEEVWVSHGIMNFPDGTTEAIGGFDLWKHRKNIKSDTGAILISE